ncbi:unnamed protein product [Alopecurus aequalis]
MADIEDPDGGGIEMAEAEADECSRRVVMCFIACAVLAFFAISQVIGGFLDSHPTVTGMTAVAAIVLAFLALLFSSGLCILLGGLVRDWYFGYPEGHRLVDRLMDPGRDLLNVIVRHAQTPILIDPYDQPAWYRFCFVED